MSTGQTSNGDAVAQQAQSDRQSRRDAAAAQFLHSGGRSIDRGAVSGGNPPSVMEANNVGWRPSEGRYGTFNADDNRRLDKEYNTPENSPLHTNQRFPNG